jgi:predicted permease
VLGVLLARPLVAVVSRFAARFSVRALEVTVDATLLWVGAALAIAAAVLLAYVPKLPATVTASAPSWSWRRRRSSGEGSTGLGLTAGGVRITPATNRRLRMFAMTQIAFSFVLLAGAGMLLATLIALQTTKTGYDMRQVLAIDLPTPSLGISDAKEIDRYLEMTRRVRELPGVEGVALGSFVPWRDAGSLGPGFTFRVEGYTPAHGEEDPRARFRMVAPGFFSVLGVPLLAGRDFTDDDRRGSEPVAIVSQSIAQRLFPDGDAVNRTIWWTEPLFGKPVPRRIVGVVADVDDENVVPGPALTMYQPVRQVGVAGRMFVHAGGDPYALVPMVTRVVREMAPNQPVERAATLADVRAEVLAPDRLNAFVVSGFAGIALLIAVVGVSGVLAFSVSARIREFGVRLAIGSTPRHLLLRVLSEGILIVAVGLIAGAIGGYAFAGLAASYFENVRLPGGLPIAAAAAILVGAAVLASLMPAARASRVDVLQALRSE